MGRVLTGGRRRAAKPVDVNTPAVVVGRERTEREYRALFQAAGFTPTRVVLTRAPLSLIGGVPSASA
jgi:hypothetical protein